MRVGCNLQWDLRAKIPSVYREISALMALLSICGDWGFAGVALIYYPVVRMDSEYIETMQQTRTLSIKMNQFMTGG